MRHLHKETTNEHLPHILIQLALVRDSDHVNVELLHRAFELCADVVCLRKRSLREVVCPCPILVVHVCVTGQPAIANKMASTHLVGSYCTHSTWSSDRPLAGKAVLSQRPILVVG